MAWMISMMMVTRVDDAARSPFGSLSQGRSSGNNRPRGCETAARPKTHKASLHFPNKWEQEFPSLGSNLTTEGAAMEGSSPSFDSPASNSIICCPKCKVATKLEYSASKSEKNFLRPYYACLKCGGFVCWSEQEGIGETMGGHECGSINRGRQRIIGGPKAQLSSI
ncbi:hypothetical protein Cgig2_012842 [Carnegiea gigantea]|uniref:GRF-like zinc ribbon domain-containing protein n=1 Tax=Carnegiea gigantea TaxID=171969 RepID=A0A9Q1K9T1_9CARY|nr:hypothetical protein Cgig2_012842 [Carnegiea gigantea]